MNNRILPSFLHIPAAFALLAACSGPWDMGVDGHSADRSLWISSVQVAGRAFDTLWIEGTSPLDRAYDPTTAAVGEGSTVQVVQDSAGVRDTVVFTSVAGLPRAWLPRAADTAKRVRWGADLFLSADLVLPDGSRKRVSASSYTPIGYAMADSFAVPMEALHPRLANGAFRLEALDLQKRGDTAALAALIRDLDPSGRFFQRWRVGDADFRAFLQGRSVMREASMKGRILDTLWYITDDFPVSAHSLVGEAPQGIQATYRQWIFRQRLDRRRSSGTVLMQGFDPTRARIVSLMDKQFEKSFGEFDTVAFFQRGDTRTWLINPNVASADVPGWPDSVLITNAYFGYTGRNRIYAWNVDSLYYEHFKVLSGETGDGRYSVPNIQGAKGYFTGAGVDSAAFDLEIANADTIGVGVLRAAWCKSTLAEQAAGKSTSIPKSQVALFCGQR